MTIFVRDLLNLNGFENAKVISGKNGLLNTVSRLSFLDSTIKELKEIGVLNNYFNIGDFLITGSNLIKNRKNIFNDSRTLTDISSGICIVGYEKYLLSKEILELFNKHNYPVIAVPGLVPYHVIIESIMNALNRDKLDKKVNDILNKLIKTNCDYDQILSYVNEINPKLNPNYFTLFITIKNNDITNTIRDTIVDYTEEVIIQKYSNGTIITITTKKMDHSFYKKEIEKIRKNLTDRFTNCYVGVSDSYNNLIYFKQSIEEAIFSNKLAKKRNRNLLKYNDLGVEKWLYQMRENKILINYANDFLQPIIDYDKEYNLNLMEIVRAFVKYEGNFKKISEHIFIHENTVRYRMDKIKSILNANNDKVSFYTKLNMAIKLKEIINL